MEKNIKRVRNDLGEYNKSRLDYIQENSTHVSSPIDKWLDKDCCIWNGLIVSSYGRIYYDGKQCGVHTVALMIAMGLNSLPEKNIEGEFFETAHKCDRPLCVEPTHLYRATKSQNGEDRAKNGLTKGEKHYNAKITDDIARDIKLSKGNGSRTDRAKQFGVSTSVIKSIDGGISWTHIPDANGNIFEEKRVKRNKTVKNYNKRLKETPW